MIRKLTIAGALIAATATAEPVRHNVLEDDTAASLQTQRACGSLTTVGGRLVCMPGSQDSLDGGGIQLDGVLKANEKGHSIVNAFLEKDVDREFLDRVFREDSFQSASGLFRLRAHYMQHALDYTPHYFMGAFKLTNPSLPEIHIAGVKEATVRYSVAGIATLPAEAGVLLWYGAVSYFDRKTVFASLDLLSSTLQNLDELVKPETGTGLFGDSGFTYVPKPRFVPQLGLSIHRLGFDTKCSACERRYLDLEDWLYTKSYVRGGYDLPVAYGRMYAGLVFPFRRLLQRYDPAETAAAHVYEIGRFRSYLSFAPMMSSFGFGFQSTLYMIGIQYTDEKQNDAILLKREKHAYIQGSYFF